MDVNSDVKELKNKGNVFYQAQNYQEAIDVYTQALSLDSKNSTLYSNRSAAFSKLSRYNEALVMLPNAYSTAEIGLKDIIVKLLLLRD
jgi:tetratricopeptide (TPR) repeat protein